jgi:alkaline phosphatase
VPRYVDGFVLPLPKSKIALYKKISKAAGKIWKDHGALQYIETTGDDLGIPGMLSFTKMAKLKPGETVVFSWIIYKSKADRNRINRKVMTDPRMDKMMKDPKQIPFNPKRMAMGGFSVIVDL